MQRDPRDDFLDEILRDLAALTSAERAATLLGWFSRLLDDRGCELRPVLREPAKKKWLFFVSVIDTVSFTFERTDERREDLLARLQAGEISIDSRSSRIRTLDDLQAIAPLLFRG